MYQSNKLFESINYAVMNSVLRIIILILYTTNIRCELLSEWKKPDKIFNNINRNVFGKTKRIEGNSFTVGVPNTKSGKTIFEPKLEDSLVDTILNSGKNNFLNTFRSRKRASLETTESSETSSSSDSQMKNSKEEWKEFWIKKKFEAINSTVVRADVVNMVAARPWGVSCGDPKQHDAPWGTCMLPMECESEYRIYRGDYLCGDTGFICCGLLLTNYDMYQAFDISFEDSELETDSEEKRQRDVTSKEKDMKERRKSKSKRRRERKRRKRKIKKQIRRIVRQIRKILNKSYRNGTTERKKRTKQLKKFINYLKKKFKDERLQVKVAHEIELYKIDSELQKKLDNIKEVNAKFVSNDTYRNMLLYGNLSNIVRSGKVQPIISPNHKSSSIKRRNAEEISTDDDHNYDIEYGMLYV